MPKLTTELLSESSKPAEEGQAQFYRAALVVELGKVRGYILFRAGDFDRLHRIENLAQEAGDCI